MALRAVRTRRDELSARGKRLPSRAGSSTAGRSSQRVERRQVSSESPIEGRIGPIIERERIRQGWTIDDLATRAGVSSGLVSQLERSIGNPSVKTLVALAGALEVPMGTFFVIDPSKVDTVVRASTRTRLVMREHGLTYELLVPDLRGDLSMLRIVLPPRFSNEERPFSHPGEECEFVLEGQLEAHIGDRVLALEEGDSFRFDSGIPHWFRTLKKRAVVISAQTPPSF